MSSQIELREVRKTYVLDDNVIEAVGGVSLEVQRGDFISIVGHSGSGKTTLLSIIGGILRPSAGTVFFEGADIYAFSPDDISGYRAEKVGFVFQFASLLPILTARENLLLPTIFKKEKGKDEDKKAAACLDMVGLGEKLNAYPSQLSGGQQRRVAIARALMNDPALILADEPTGDLDEETEREVMELFKRLNGEKGITFILVTHSSELAKAASRRLRMAGGKLSGVE